MMHYLTTAQIAKKWGITPTRITILAKNNRIPGAVYTGSQWMIPDTAEKPADGRTKEVKNYKSSEEICFRYPSFECLPVASIFPPINEEEIRLKQAMEECYACRFDAAARILGNLSDHTTNLYRRINALRISCLSSIFLNHRETFLDSYRKLTEAMLEDFPYKTETSFVMYELAATLGDSSYFSESFSIDPGYQYHQSFLPHLGALCSISLFFSNNKKLTAKDLSVYELNCAAFDNSENYVDSQTIHLYLGGTYALLGLEEACTRHLRKALELAQEYELFYGPATLYYYMERAFEHALSGFPKEFQNHFKHCSSDVHRRYVRFMDSMSYNSYFKLLRNKEYILVLYALQGHQNKEIARRLNISEKTVSKRYSVLYDLLGVKNKRELVDLVGKKMQVEHSHGIE